MAKPLPAGVLWPVMRINLTKTRPEGTSVYKGPSPVLCAVLSLVGLLLLSLAALASYSSDYIFAAHGKVFVRFPGMLPGQFYFLSAWWVFVGLPVVLFAAGWLFPAFRAAVRAPWRQARYAVPLVVSVVLFALTLIPGEYAATPPWHTGTKMVFYVIVAGAGLVLFLAGAYRHLRFLDAPAELVDRWLMSLDRRYFVLLLFGFTFAVTNLISWLVFDHMPHIQDSTAQVFQARIFASGRLYLRSPKFPDFFDYTHIINNGRWYSQYSFLHSLFLMFGVLVGAPWLVNPLLGALTVPSIYILGRDLYGERTGRLAGVLAAICPFIFNMSSEFMNHASTLLFCTLFLIFYFRTLGTGRWFHPLLAGVALGAVANIRPYTALAFAAPLAVYGVYRIVREPGRLLPRFALMVVVTAVVTSLVFFYNWLTNGNPFLWGYVVKWGPGHEIGFGKSAWGEVHTPYRGLINSLNVLNQTNKFLFEWPIPSLLPIVLLFASGTRDRRDWLLLSGFVSLVVAFFFYWFYSVCFGPRFLYESSAGLIILTVRGMQEAGSFLRQTCGLATSDLAVSTFVRRVWPVLTVLMLGVGLPPLFRTYHCYHEVNADLLRTVKRHKLKNAVVFCHNLGHAFNANSLNLDGDVVYARDYGVLNSALTLSYPDRDYYYGNRDTLRRLQAIEYERSRLKRALDEMAAFVADTLAQNYRTLIWPFNDIPAPDVGPGPRAVDPRQLSREIFTGQRRFDDCLPALACWIVNDPREHLRVFAFMNELQNVLAGGYKFTLLMVTSDGTGAVYDISTATGNELTVPDRPTPVPVR